MSRVAFITCTFTALLTVAGCSSPDEKANTLYVQASIAAQEAMLAQKQRRYQKAFASYEDARDRIERILSNYSSSSVAVELISGERQIFKMPLETFRELGMPMKIAADVEEDPLVSALFFAAKLDKPYSTQKAEVLIRIARGYT
ncbi:MAG TPA: hypothetical protein PLE77_12470, partial [Kiritimatiellia bacterium]|nr:hypothetical protein [Kiritimatiellia bacterium]